MGEVIQLQGDHRTKVMEFLTDKSKDKMGKYALGKDQIKVCIISLVLHSQDFNLILLVIDPRLLVSRHHYVTW